MTPTALAALKAVPAGILTEIQLFDVVFPSITNHYGTLFGGDAYGLMDKAAFILASRYARQRVVTRYSSEVKFERPLKQGTLVELRARIYRTGETSMHVEVDLIAEALESGARELATSARFVLVAVDEHGEPRPVPPLPYLPSSFFYNSNRRNRLRVRSVCLGFPRIGVQRELKKAQEAYWRDPASPTALLAVGRELRLRHWQLQQAAGVDEIPCNDFSLYDQMLDMCALLGAVPTRYNWRAETVDLATYFAMARGTAAAPAMAMKKWFDTNYHYTVPEFEAGQRFRVASSKVFDEFSEARAAGIEAVPVLIGPVSFALLGEAKYADFSLTELLERLLPVYAQVLQQLQALGASRVQIDEPCLVTDLSLEAQQCLQRAYEYLREQRPALQIRLASYFGEWGENAALALRLPVQALHLDLSGSDERFEEYLQAAKSTGHTLVLGVINGRNIWRNDLRTSLARVTQAIKVLGAARVAVAPSCSLLHVPIDADGETAMPEEIRSWIAFARQKLEELALLKQGANEGGEAIRGALAASEAVQASRRTSPRIHDPKVKARLAGITPDMQHRKSPYAERHKRQQAALKLPKFPTTTIGSFPQTNEIRTARAAHAAGRMNDAEYDRIIGTEIERVVRFQERVGLDVAVHGEPERNDMVEFFGERLAGFVPTQNGWVQSYGSRSVKPPILYGDVSRPKAMTVRWSEYAQALTKLTMKGMLTGPVTIEKWSFVRDDQPLADTCLQIALAIRDEVQDLERANIRVIQIDEPAIREGLPLRKAQWEEYLRWAVQAFRLASSSVRDETQIHTHMCYSEFNDIIASVAAMDADVITIETSRSHMKLLDAFVNFAYPNEIGPGLYDIHSPRLPTAEEMTALLQKARAVLPAERLWINPDCGLKTRGWLEVEQALTCMVQVARQARAA